MNAELESDLNKLKELYPKGLEHVWDVLASASIRAMKEASKDKFGEEQVIGVFGPYSNGGEKVIVKVSRTVSDLGRIALTGRGFFLPKSAIMTDLKEIMPIPVPAFKKVIPGHIFYREFVQLVDRAIFFENIERGQFAELQGCSAHSIPALGFIRHKTIVKSKTCNYCIIKASYLECTAQAKDICQGATEPRPFFCPFYDSVDMPWFSKQLFMTKENRLVAIRRITSLRKIIQEFLS